MTLHDTPPMITRIHGRCGRRFASDGGRIEQHFRTLQRENPRRFRKPLVPADCGPYRAARSRPHVEAGITWAKIELFLVAGTVGNVRLAVTAEHAAVAIDDRQ